MAFFPCIYFTGSTNPCYMTLENTNYRGLSLRDKYGAIIARSAKREVFFSLLVKLCAVCHLRSLPLIVENPWHPLSYLNHNFLAAPSLIDANRQLRGDFYKKPTAYWFFGCKPTKGFSRQEPKEKRVVFKELGGEGGICNRVRSEISPDYARNFVCDFILGRDQGLEAPLFATLCV